jgi:hypothetical protein
MVIQEENKIKIQFYPRFEENIEWHQISCKFTTKDKTIRIHRT